MLTPWPYPYGQTSTTTIGGLPAWVVYLLAGLAAFLALALIATSAGVFCWRARKKQKATKGADPYYDSMDVFGEEKDSKDAFKPQAAPPTPRPYVPRSRTSKAPEVQYETVHV